MGVLDTPAGSAIARPLEIVTLLREGTKNLELVVLGDSTGNNTNEWAYLLAVQLGTLFPAYTVSYLLWNDGTQLYDSPVTIQTGSGSFTLTVHNASTPAMDAAYSTSRIALQVPTSPDCVVINYGHNGTVTPYRGVYYTLVRTLKNTWPHAQVVATAQNPRQSNDAGYAADLLRQQEIIRLAQEQGWPLIDALTPFLLYPSYSSALMTDNIHPNATGQLVWFADVMKWFGPTASRPYTAVGGPEDNRRWLPAAEFQAISGSPVLGLITNDLKKTWSLPDAATTVLGTSWEIPTGWDSVNVWVSWVTDGTGGAGNVEFQGKIGYIHDKTAVNVGTVTAVALTGSLVLQNVTNTTLLNKAIKLFTDQALTGRVLALTVQRNGSSASDTFGGTAYLNGVLIERAS